MKYLLAFISISLLVVACKDKNSFTTNGGTLVTYIKKGEGSTPVDSLVSLFEIKYTTENGFVIFESSEAPMPLKIDKETEIDQGELFVVLSQLKTGDSVVFNLIAKELFQKTFKAPLPDSIPETSNINFQIAFVDQLSEEDYYIEAEKIATKAAEQQIKVDVEIIDEYLLKNGIEAEKTDSGLRYIVKKEGTGELPKTGQSITVHYAGYLMDSTYFDTSMESVAKAQGIFTEGRPYDPFSFVLGERQVIKGWDEGIALLSAGSEAQLFIPSPLGYGSRGNGGIIKPNAILIFDVSLLKIENN